MHASGQGPKTALDQGPHDQARKDIRHPVRQEDDSRCNNQAADTPCDRRQLWRCPGDGGGDRADMHGVAGRKGVIGPARAWNAMTAAMDHLPIRPLLVDQPLQKMRQDRGRTHAQQQVIGLSTRASITSASAVTVSPM